MMLHELKPNHRLGDIVVFRDDIIESKEILVQAKIIGARASLEDNIWVWSYEVHPVESELVHYLKDQHILFNLTKETSF